MKPEIYYVVESKFWRREIGNILDNLIAGIKYDDALVKSLQVFTDDSPIIASEMAFSHFASIIDVLYEGLGKKYSSDAQARIDLQKYFDSNNGVEMFGNKPEIRQIITDDIFNGIEIYMVIDKPLEKSKNKQCQKILIHGIRYIDYPARLDDNLVTTLEGLFKEYKYYENSHYSTKDYTVLKSFEPIGGDAEFFLNTPFDWDTFMDDFDGKKMLTKVGI